MNNYNINQFIFNSLNFNPSKSNNNFNNNINQLINNNNFNNYMNNINFNNFNNNMNNIEFNNIMNNIDFHSFKNKENSKSSNSITIFFNYDDKQFILDVNKNDKIKSIINELNRKEHTPINASLYFEKDNELLCLDNNKTVDYYEIKDKTTLLLLIGNEN